VISGSGYRCRMTATFVPRVAQMIGMEIPDELAALILAFLAPLPRWS
jgi:hypothetical protein